MSFPGFLPYSRQTVDDDDVAAVAAALRSDYLTTGPLVEAFETAFATVSGATHAVACNSGTAALHLAVLAVDLGPGDAAVVPTTTFLATANVVRMTGAEAIFADVDSETGLLTPETLSEACQRARVGGALVKVALPVHLNGQLCDMEGLSAVAKAEGIDLIEDACHALGVADIGAARHSRVACFSTHAVKAIPTGEGGVVTTSDPALAERMRQLRSHGMIRDKAAFVHRGLAFDGADANPWYYEMAEIGWNYRLPDVLCALGVSQIRKLDMMRKRRIEIVSQYDRLFAAMAPAIVPVPHDRPHGWHLYPLLIDFAALGMTRARMMNLLRADGIGTQVHYIPVHRQPYYKQRYGEQTLPGADRYYDRCLSIPFYPGMSDADVERVAAAFAKFIPQTARVASR
ncbi:MAG: UDP-4-amino-4,6-dideoxy-N-acetyl-beta-L-altrosamine transaminase [Pseudolabrys sp.]|nr:UDP-4-amino-4,6-dideoxy-N-acetyl-beta-L-altrosamine transaminase [Pseudolabrys sp.]